MTEISELPTYATRAQARLAAGDGAQVVTAIHSYLAERETMEPAQPVMNVPA